MTDTNRKALVIGYVQKGIVSLSEEEQKEILLGRLSNERQIIYDSDKRRVMLTVLSEMLEPGSEIYVASLSVLGSAIYKIYSVLERLSDAGITVIAIKENFNSNIKNDYNKYMQMFSDIEKDTLFSKEVHEKADTNRSKKSGRKAIPITPEMEEIFRKYENNEIKYRDAKAKLGVSHATFYRLREKCSEKSYAEDSEYIAERADKVNEQLNEIGAIESEGNND